jgi:hypothetical protein
MPVDEIAEGIFSFIWSTVLQGTCHFIGFYTLRCITLGRYPPKANQQYSEKFVVAVGCLMLFCFVLVAVFMAYN